MSFGDPGQPLARLGKAHPVVKLLDEIEQAVRSQRVSLGFALARACLIGLELNRQQQEQRLIENAKLKAELQKLRGEQPKHPERIPDIILAR